MKILIRPTDKLMSILVRRLANGRCQYCGQVCEIYNADGSVERIKKLEASHYHGRVHEGTRMALKNVSALCFTCHQTLGGYQKSEQGDYDLWMKSRLGNEYWQLKLAAFQNKKRDDVFDMMWLIQELKKLGIMEKPKKEKKEMCCNGKFVKKYCALHMVKPDKKKHLSVDNDA